MLQSPMCNSFSLWTEAAVYKIKVNTARYVRNRCPLNHTGNKTPYESKERGKPYIEFIKNFDSKVIALNKRCIPNKFASRGKKYILVEDSQKKFMEKAQS